MAFGENLDVFFEDADGAYYDGSTDPVKVWFDRAYIEAATGIASADPIALGKASDFASPVGKTLVISGTSYTVRNAQPQDDGALVLLQLEAQ